MATSLDQLFAKVRAENRAALIAYIPAGFPSIEGCHKAIKALVAGGVDAIEIGFPYSDPVMDGPIIQAAAERSLSQGTGASDVFAALKCATDAGVSAVVMTYWNMEWMSSRNPFLKMAALESLHQISLLKNLRDGVKRRMRIKSIASM